MSALTNKKPKPLSLKSRTEAERKKDSSELITLFSLDGVECKVPKRFKANVALKFMRMARNRGETIATAWLMEEILGEESYEVLMNFEDLTVENLEALSEVVKNLVMGDDNSGPKG